MIIIYNSIILFEDYMYISKIIIDIIFTALWDETSTNQFMVHKLLFNFIIVTVKTQKSTNQNWKQINLGK